MNSLKADCFLWLVTEEEVRDLKHDEDGCTIASFEDGGGEAQGMWVASGS